jgi:hypothetical protein
MEQAKTWIYNHRRVIGAVLAAILFIAVCVMLFRGCSKKPETVTQETQTEAQTEGGVEKAADNADVPINRQQAQDAAKEIHYIYSHDTKPEYTIITTGGDAEKASQAAQERAGADFSIVTDKDKPDEKVSLDELPKDSTVNINQYNVQAYKKVLHTIEFSPDLDGGHGVSEIGYTVSRKVTKDGKYLGAGASYNLDDHKAYVKISYTW